MSLKLAARHKLYFKFGGASFSFRGEAVSNTVVAKALMTGVAGGEE